MLNMSLCLQVQGLIISQMLRKSVETRDWVNTIEPRNVRAVMKRVVEDTTSIDVQVQFVFRWRHHLRMSPRSFLSSPCVEREDLLKGLCFTTGRSALRRRCEESTQQ